MLRKAECDNIFVLAQSEDRANTKSHIIMTLTESGASCINKSPLPQPGVGGREGGCHESRRHTREGTMSLQQLLTQQIPSLQLRESCSWD